MADKLLLVTHLRRADAAGPRAGEPPADLAHGAHHQPRRRHRADGGDRQPRDRPADVPAVDLRQDRDRHLHRDRGRGDALQLPAATIRCSSTCSSTRRWRSRWSRASTTSGTRRGSSRRDQCSARSDVVEARIACSSSSAARVLRGCVWRRFVPAVVAQTPPKQAVVETSAGTFVIDLTPDAAPNQAAYFMKLAQEGGYDGTIFHRVVKYGMVQGGDPLSKDPAKRSAVRHRRAERGQGRGARAEDDARLGGGRARPGQAGQRRRAVLHRPRRSAGARRPVHGVRPGVGRHGGAAEDLRDAGRRGRRSRPSASRSRSVTIRDTPPEPFVNESPQQLGALPRGARHQRGADHDRVLPRQGAGDTSGSSCGWRTAGVYDGMAFHRVAPGFVIQTGALVTAPAPLTEKQQKLVHEPAAGVQRHEAREGHRLDGARRRSGERARRRSSSAPARRRRSTASTRRSGGWSTGWRPSRRSRRRRGPARRRTRASSCRTSGSKQSA